jgi:Sec-independent protein translocase protein TatA
MEIFNVGGPELILLLFFAGVLLGPRRMVLMAREIGEFLNQIKLISRNLTKELNREIDLLDREMRITQPAQLVQKAESNGVEVTASDSQLDKAKSTEISGTDGGNHSSNGHVSTESSKAEEDSHLPEAYKRFIEDFPGEGLDNESLETEGMEKQSLEVEGLEEERLEIPASSSIAGAPTD